MCAAQKRGVYNFRLILKVTLLCKEIFLTSHLSLQLLIAGTASGQSNVRSLTAVNETDYVGARSFCDDSLSLVDNTTYYSTVVVSNGAVNSLSVTVSSNGGWYRPCPACSLTSLAVLFPVDG